MPGFAILWKIEAIIAIVFVYVIALGFMFLAGAVYLAVMLWQWLEWIRVG